MIEGIFFTLFFVALVCAGLVLAVPIAALVQHLFDKRQRPMASRRR